MKKSLLIALILLSFALTGLAAPVIWAEESSTSLAADLSDFSFTLEGTHYSLPFAFADLAAQGWELGEEGELTPGQTTYLPMAKGEQKARVYLANVGSASQSFSEGQVVGASFDQASVHHANKLVFPDNIQLGSLAKDMLAAYGETAETFELKDQTIYTYSFLTGQAHISVGKKSGQVERVSLFAPSAALALYKEATSTESLKQNLNDPDAVRIGVLEPFSGLYAAAAQMDFQGMELAQTMVPEVLGRKIALVKADNKSDQLEAYNVAQRLVTQDKVVAVLGPHTSMLSQAAAPVFLEEKVPGIATAATSPSVTVDNPYFFRVCVTDTYQGMALAQFAMESLGAKTAAILQDLSSDYSVGLCKQFANTFKDQLGGEAIVFEGSYKAGDQDFGPQLNNLMQANPDIIFCPGNYGDCALLIKQARDLGITAPILGGDTWDNPDFLKIGGDALDQDVYFASHYNASLALTEEADRFAKAYTEKYGEEPTAYAALGYDAYMLLIDAIERAGSTDPEAIRAALLETGAFEGATGTLTFDQEGSPVKSMVITKVVDGAFVAQEATAVK